jgi:hypothetical protein
MNETRGKVIAGLCALGMVAAIDVPGVAKTTEV